MDQEVRARWTEKLRSGEYTQGRSRLTKVEDDGSFTHCCLGVLCEILVADGVATRDFDKFAKEFSYGLYDEWDATKYVGYLSPGIIEVLGFEGGSSGRFIDPASNQGEALTDLNDDGLPFAEIADRIDAAFGPKVEAPA